jgi:hypothetical protein
VVKINRQAVPERLDLRPAHMGSVAKAASAQMKRA